MMKMHIVPVHSQTFSFELRRLAGLITDGNCTWCAAGKYQTGVGMAAEVDCTLCIAGKYQTGSGLDIVPFDPKPIM